MLLLAATLACAAVLLVKPPGGPPARLRRAVPQGTPPARRNVHRLLPRSRLTARNRTMPAASAMTLVVQQLAALLKGGRTPGRLWDELWMLYAPGPRGTGAGPGGRGQGAGLSGASLAVLGAARAAAATGSPVSEAIRKAAPPSAGPREARIWWELAACLDIAEASGCPLADVLSRFAAQLEVEDDAEAARQTALAGPKATVALLTWLPLMGLGLGAALGVDPLAVLLGTPLGLAALAAGIALTVAGRFWSARLVAAAAGAGVP